jgi:hypothetical protein
VGINDAALPTSSGDVGEYDSPVGAAGLPDGGGELLGGDEPGDGVPPVVASPLLPPPPPSQLPRARRIKKIEQTRAREAVMSMPLFAET